MRVDGVLQWRVRCSSGRATVEFNYLKRKQLGIFARAPVEGEVKTRLSPPLSPGQGCELYRAFLIDLSRRLRKLSSIDMTVFHAGGAPETLEGLIPRRAKLVAQEGESLGERLCGAFALLLGSPEGTPSAVPSREPGAVIIGSDSPDLPLQYIGRAFQKLRHHDVVIGPAADGGYYLIGLSKPCPDIFQGISWGSDRVYGETLVAVERAGLTLATLPLWYDVDSAHGLGILRNEVLARRLARRDRLAAVEEVLRRIDETS
jgi:rSAM/selenodomain-associated transferase 1